jgi:hypothetical protein
VDGQLSLHFFLVSFPVLLRYHFSFLDAEAIRFHKQSERKEGITQEN